MKRNNSSRKNMKKTREKGNTIIREKKVGRKKETYSEEKNNLERKQ